MFLKKTLRIKIFLILLIVVSSFILEAPAFAQLKREPAPETTIPERTKSSPIIQTFPTREREATTGNQSTLLSEDKPLYTAGDITIMENDFRAEAAKLAVKDSQTTFDLLNDMVTKEVLYREALKKGFDKNLETQIASIPDKKEQKKLVVDAFIRESVEKDASVSDAEATEYYEKNKAMFTPIAQYHSYILSVQKFDRSYKDITQRAGQEAEVIRERLLKGELPEAIWKSYSDSEFLVQATPRFILNERTPKTPKEIKELIPDLKEGSVSPVCELGSNRFDVFKVTKIVEAKAAKSAEEIKDSIRNSLRQKKINAIKENYVRNFIKDNKPTIYNKEHFK
ncbi:MAG: peptidyl-prolyl cis-trans isomerase [Nitrospira sp.]|nr:peptidyl-prolyl cis-trans isomerase [Nitrospira sp.]